MTRQRLRQSEIARLIGSHFDAHGRAADTSLGIRQFWLGEAGASARLEDVEGALRSLVEAGRIRAETLPDGRVVYRRATADPPEQEPDAPPQSRRPN